MLLWGQKPFSATQVPSLQAWYDFSNSAYLTLVSTAITQALDRSGNGNHTDVQATTTKRPTWAAAQLNGLSTATFDGGDTLALPSALYTLANGNNTVFTVSQTGSGTNARIITLSEAGSSRLYVGNASATAVEYQSSTSVGVGPNVTANPNIYNLFTGFRSGTTQSISVDGGTAATNTGGLDESGVDAAFIGSRADTGLYLTGGIAEILIYNRALSVAEINQVELYLANKWGIYHPNAGWIGAYTPWQQMLIRAWGINKDDSFTNTTANPFAAIYDPSAAALGSTTSLADTGRGVNTATEATNPPVNTAVAIGTANGLLYNGTTTILNAGSDSTIDDIFASGGCFIGVCKPTTTGENDGGRLFDKAETVAHVVDASGGACKIRFVKFFSVTNGDWILTNRNVTLGAANIAAITYSSANVANNPTIYVNSLTPKAVTQTLIPTLTPTSDAATNLRLGNNLGSTRTFDGYIGKMVFLKSVPTTAQLTSVFNFLATEYGVTLT